MMFNIKGTCSISLSLAKDGDIDTLPRLPKPWSTPSLLPCPPLSVDHRQRNWLPRGSDPRWWQKYLCKQRNRKYSYREKKKSHEAPNYYWSRRHGRPPVGLLLNSEHPVGVLMHVPRPPNGLGVLVTHFTNKETEASGISTFRHEYWF